MVFCLLGLEQYRNFVGLLLVFLGVFGWVLLCGLWLVCLFSDPRVSWISRILVLSGFSDLVPFGFLRLGF